MTAPGDPLPSFEFATATRIVFGPGRLQELGPLARDLGRRALIVTGSHPERAQPLRDLLSEAGVSSETFPIHREPTTLDIATGLARAKLTGCNLVVGFGGGSAIDAAKAVAGLLTNDRDLFDSLEVVGRGQPLTRPAAPWIAIPTTAGAGAEVTRNAVLTSREHKVKASLRSPLLLARVALVDPRLTLDLPPAVTLTTGLDALTQLIEPFVGLRANPLVDALCLDGIRRIRQALATAVTDGRNLAARTEMALAALYGGIALANAGLGVVHGLAAPIGGSHPAPHGAVCAALLAPSFAGNVRALRARAPDSPALARYAIVARELTTDPGATPETGAAWLADWLRTLGAPSLSSLGIPNTAFADLAEKGLAASSMKSNPVPLTRDELIALLEAASGTPASNPRA